ncbi:MAG TPA: response regulator [Blastocatellia bacterium]|nr:response regulator [Blastocatellia bacterium]
MTAPVRILNVEDDPLDTEIIGAVLKRDGLDCELDRVETRDEFLAALGRGGFDLILSDFSLPSFDGLSALAIRQERCPDAPFILISGTIGEEAAIRAFELGATDYVLKQRLERLTPSVHRALREAAEHAERMRAEADLRLAHQRLRFHIENSPLAVIEWDSDLRVRYWSPQAERLFGWNFEEVRGRSPREWPLVHEEDAEIVHQDIARLLEGRAARDIAENRNYTRDGSVIWCQWYNSALLDESGRLVSILSLALDITERKRSEEERSQLLAREQAAREAAEMANRAKDEFLAAVSHELRTPLTPVLGWLRLVRTGGLAPEAAAGALEKIERNVRAEVRLVEDLLDVSSIITGKLRVDMRPLEPAPVIEAAINSMRPAAEAREITLVQRLEPDTGLISGDQDRLRQILWNLLSNALRFTPQGGRVEVRLERVQSHIEIFVSDNGQGISAEFLPFVFDRFRQADASLTRVHGGLGLGLAIVRHLVELHGGTVHAESAGPGAGATFSIKLPLIIGPHETGRTKRRPEALAGTLAAGSKIRLDGLRVLAVDDDPDTLEVLSYVLQQGGADVRTAISVDEALEIFRGERPDILISDLGLPERDGYDLIAAVRELEGAQEKQTPAIALTAYTRVEDRLRVLGAGFQMHIPKPVEPAELLAVVASLTGRIRRG